MLSSNLSILPFTCMSTKKCEGECCLHAGTSGQTTDTKHLNSNLASAFCQANGQLQTKAFGKGDLRTATLSPQWHMPQMLELEMLAVSKWPLETRAGWGMQSVGRTYPRPFVLFTFATTHSKQHHVFSIISCL